MYMRILKVPETTQDGSNDISSRNAHDGQGIHPWFPHSTWSMICHDLGSPDIPDITYIYIIPGIVGLTP